MAEQAARAARFAGERSRLGPTGDANLASGDDQELAVSEILSVACQDGSEPVDLDRERRPGKPEEDDASVREPLVKDQLAKVIVGNDKDPPLRPGDRENDIIVETMRVIPGHNVDIMPKGL